MKRRVEAEGRTSAKDTICALPACERKVSGADQLVWARSRVDVIEPVPFHPASLPTASSRCESRFHRTWHQSGPLPINSTRRT